MSRPVVQESRPIRVAGAFDVLSDPAGADRLYELDECLLTAEPAG